MYKVLLFGGTVEGRTVAEYLNENKIPSMVCVATEYGESLLPQGEYLELSHERLDEKQMEERMLQMENGLVIDATHPYAQVVTENIETACERTGTAYLRVVRQESRRLEEEETITYVKSIREAVEYLEKTSGNILVTTGSKELSAYTALTDYQERIYARVLSLVEVVASCAKLGIEGKHLLCMQGPFSREMNIALIHQFDIAWMVSKESGRAGGFLEKYQAAKETGCRMIVIGRPKEEQGMELEKCIEYLNRRFLPKENVANDAKIEIVNTDTENIENIENPGSGQEKVAQEPVMQEAATQNTEAVTEGEETEDILRGQKVSLVGIGMGTADTLTQEGKQALECADRSSTDGGTYPETGPGSLDRIQTGRDLCLYCGPSGAQKRGDCPLRGCRILQRSQKTPGDTAPGTADGTEKSVLWHIFYDLFLRKTGNTVGRCSSGQPSWKRVQSARTSAYIRKDFCYCGNDRRHRKIVSEAAALRHG